MKESPYVSMSNLLNEHEFSFDVLRIIAKDRHALTSEDREHMLIAADQLEASYRNIFIVAEKLAEAKQQNQALSDALMEARKLVPAPFVNLEHNATMPFNPYLPRK